MLKKLIGVCAVAAVAAVAAAASACADHGPYFGGGGGFAVALADCDGFYDDFYGPYADGCWGDDGYYWYRSSDGHYHRDTGHHFSHQAGGTMHAIQGTGPGVGMQLGARPPEQPRP